MPGSHRPLRSATLLAAALLAVALAGCGSSNSSGAIRVPSARAPIGR
jgi:hypothetical protein